MLQLRFLDHYKLLHVSEDATPAETSRAYGAAVDALPHRWMDRFVAGLAGRSAARYRIAYEELSDSDKRDKYDRYLAYARKSMLSLLH